MAGKLMYITKDNTQFYPFCRLQLMGETFGYSIEKPTNHNSIKVKVYKPINKITLT